MHIRGDVSNFTTDNYLDHGIHSLDDDCSDLKNVRLFLPHVHHTLAHVDAPRTVVYTRANDLSPVVEFSLRLEQGLEGVSYQPYGADGKKLGLELGSCGDAEGKVPPGVVSASVVGGDGDVCFRYELEQY